MQSAWRDSLAKNYEGGLESLGLSFPDFSLEFVKTDSMDIFYQMLSCNVILGKPLVGVQYRLA